MTLLIKGIEQLTCMLNEQLPNMVTVNNIIIKHTQVHQQILADAGVASLDI